MANTKLNILLVEDEPSHVELVCRAFEKSDKEIELRVANTLEEAKEFIVEAMPDLLLADLLLPDGKGTDLLPEDDRELPFPVIVVTSFGNEQMAVESMQHGALDYIVKSESAFAEMPRTVERTIRQWKSITARRVAENALQRAHDDLEDRVMERTVELAKAVQQLQEANEQLEEEIAERKRIESQLLNDKKALRKLLEREVREAAKTEEEPEEEEELSEVPETAHDIPAEEAPEAESAGDSDDVSLEEPPTR